VSILTQTFLSKLGYCRYAFGANLRLELLHPGAAVPVLRTTSRTTFEGDLLLSVTLRPDRNRSTDHCLYCVLSVANHFVFVASLNLCVICVNCCL
jgi:hypothetical protein